MKRLRFLTLFFVLLVAVMTMAEERRMYLGYLFSESQWEDVGKTRYGTSRVVLDSITSCYAFYYKGSSMTTPVYIRKLNKISSVTRPFSETGFMYKGKSADGTYFVEKQFHRQPEKEGILFYQIPEKHLEEVIRRLDKQWYLPLELFQDSLLRLMNYTLIGALWEKYEEGRAGGAFVNLGRGKYCLVSYFQGAMMSTPRYLSQIKEIEYVNRSDSSQTNSKYSSKTGRLDYGKATDGTYFVEKLFYQNQRLPQGIIIFKIPEEFYEDILQRMVLLPSLPTELLSDSWNPWY